MATPLTKQSDLTTNNYKRVRVVALNDQIQEDITLLIEGTIINCFISYCPYQIEVGKFYDVELTINIPEDYVLERAEPSSVLAEKIDPGYSYILYGELCDERLLTFTSLSDEGIHYDHPELNGSFVKLTVERIDASFH
ncbi:hypothetical protein AOA57_30845 [Pseudomonas sp. 2588-5]|nr:hypothetical protein AOA57_30845 [Pseudomonas sp. 2588-5]